MTEPLSAPFPRDKDAPLTASDLDHFEALANGVSESGWVAVEAGAMKQFVAAARSASGIAVTDNIDDAELVRELRQHAAGTPYDDTKELVTAAADRIEARQKSVTPDDGGPAFPWGEHGVRLGGLTMRDWFAGQALTGMLAAADAPKGWTVEKLAGAAFDFANAMIAERQK